MSDRGKHDRRDLVRSALRAAAGPEEPNVDRLVRAVPGIMAEARRRSQAPLDPIAAILPVARWAVPGLAVAAAVLVIAASLAALTRPATTGRSGTGLDSLILTGSVGDDSADPLLEALAEGGG
jgi:hypothetical protein